MIAISYRREDSLPVAGRLYDRMQAEFGKDNVFMDFDSIPYGVDFRDHIKKMIGRSRVVVAMIGPDWAGKRRFRSRRIDDPADFVRLEITYALETGLPLIPILINDTPMPNVRDLPVGIEALAFRNALSLDAGIDFHHHADRLVAAIKWLLAQSSPPASPAPAEQYRQISAQIQTPPAAAEIPALPEETKELLPISPKLAPFEPPRPAAPETTHEESSSDHAERPESTAPVPDQAAPPIATQPPPAVETPRPRPSKRRSKLSQTTKTSVPTSSVNKENWRRHVKQSVTRLQDKVMADYVRPYKTTRDRIKSPGSSKRLARLGAIVLLAIAGVMAAWYWNAQRSNTSSGKAKAASSSESAIIKTAPEPSPQATVASVPSITPNAAAAYARGSLSIDSTPRGRMFELVDADGNHKTGTTPTVMQDLATGYAQVAYHKQDGSIEHTEAVWIPTDQTSSVTWNFTSESAPKISTTTAPLLPTTSNWQPRINEFVKQFVESDGRDVDQTVAFYAPNADIFGEGRKDLDSIRRDIFSYHERWPTRRDRINGNVKLSETVPNQEYTASFQQDYYVENPTRREWIKGAVAVDLGVTILDGSPRVSSIKQKTLSRQKGTGKGPRPMETPTPTVSAKGPRSSSAVHLGPQNLVRIFNRAHGFSTLVPAEIFPEAAAQPETDQTSFSSANGRTTLTLVVRQNAGGQVFNKLYEDWTAEHTAAQPHKKVHYKPFRGKWFVVSGVDGEHGERGFYVKAVNKGNQVVMMSLEYDENASPLKNETLLKMSQAFDGN